MNAGGRALDQTGTHATTHDAPSRTFLVIEYVSWVGISAHSMFIALFALTGVPVLAGFNLLSVGAWVAARAANRRQRTRLAVFLLVLEVILHAVLAVHLLGWQSGFHYYLIPLIPFLMFNDQLPSRIVVSVSALIALIYVVLRATTLQVVPPLLWTERAAWWAEYANILVPLAALAIISIYFRFGSVDVERRMEALAMTDALTRLPNRRRIREMLHDERARAARSGRPFGVVLADIDGFKLINDTRGHDCGDQVLRDVATLLRSLLRAQDAVARWGGEEFLFLLPDTDAAGAGVVAEKLRRAIEQANLTFAGQPLQVTMTFGVTAYSKAHSLDECVRQADQALYAGKHQGRNRIMLAG